MLGRVNAGDRNVCPTCAKLSGPQSSGPFESEWLRQSPDLFGWIAVGGPESAHTHPHCRCQLWQYDSVAAPKPVGWGEDVGSSSDSGWAASGWGGISSSSAGW